MYYYINNMYYYAIKIRCSACGTLKVFKREVQGTESSVCPGFYYQ